MTFHADRDRLISEFITLAKIDSVSFHERRMADQLRERLQALGFAVEEDEAGARPGSEAGNLYGFLAGARDDREPVLFSAHMDTVEPGLNKKPVLSGDRITSDGTTVLGADDLCGIVEILEGIRLAGEDPAGHGDIEVLFTVGEEAYGKGSRAFDYSKIRSKDAFVMDVSGPVGSAVRKAPTILSFRAEIEGRAAHAGFEPGSGINALQAAARAISRIPQGKLDDDTTLNVGTIRAGTADNIVPESCVCTGEIRSFDHEAARKLSQTIRRIFEEEAEKEGAGFAYEEEVRIRAYETPASSRVCRDFQSACERIGLPGELTEALGGSDNNVFAEHGIEGIVPASGMYRIHSTEEYAEINDLVRGAELVAEIIKGRGRTR